MADRTLLSDEAQAQFWALVDLTNDAGCWPWLGPKIPAGYGYWRMRGAHRWAYEMAVGPIPPKYEIDHLCRNTSCVRPNHLEAITKRENIRRSLSPGGLNAKKVRAICGHPYDAVTPRGARECVACRRRRHRELERLRRQACGQWEATPERRGQFLREIGRLGAAAVLAKYTPEQRSEFGRRAAATRNANKGPATHCKRGHEYATVGAYVNPASGRRSCRACMREREASRGRRRVA